MGLQAALGSGGCRLRLLRQAGVRTGVFAGNGSMAGHLRLQSGWHQVLVDFVILGVDFAHHSNAMMNLRLRSAPSCGSGSRAQRHRPYHANFPVLRRFPNAPCATPSQDSTEPVASTSSPDPAAEQQWREHYGDADPAAPSPMSRGLVTGVAVSLAVAFAASNLVTGGPSLAMLEQQSVPLDVALRNAKPTVIEFYANWCETCKELVPDEYRVEQRYGQDVNFVMLNIENSKWAPEMAEYGVGGVPHFVFLDGSNQPLAAAVGRLPRKVLEGNVQALSEGRDLPFLKAAGQTSSVTRPGAMEGPRQANPRDHA